MAKTTARKSAKSARKSSKKSSKKTAKKSSRKRGSGKRELITPRGDARFVRRTASGRFSESDDVGRSLKADRRKKSKKKVKSGYGDRGDR
jgi:hypothetical protein